MNHTGSKWKCGIVLVTDLLFLVSLFGVGFLWMIVGADIPWGSKTFTLVWKDRLLFWPLIFLAIHGIVISYGQTGTPVPAMGLLRFKAVQRLIMIYAGLMLPLIVTDKVLRHIRYDVHVAPIVLKSKSNGVERYHDDLLKDPELLWKFEPGRITIGRRINRLGFREREVRAQKEPGVRRVICLGDSVTAQGWPGYSQYLHELLTNAPPDGGRWEAFNMGVYGYSSQQGLRQFELWATNLQPDIVTVSFGRNDHNLARQTDRSRMAIQLSPWEAVGYNLLDRRRVGRLLLAALEHRHAWVGRAFSSRVRVSPEEFRENMNLFVKEIRAVGAIPILVTAPRRAISSEYVEDGYARSVAEFQKQHDDYAQIVRDVAKETGAPLLDLQNRMAGKYCDSFFASDAIHFDSYSNEGDMTCAPPDQPGLRRIAREMYDLISTLCATSAPMSVSSAP